MREQLMLGLLLMENIVLLIGKQVKRFILSIIYRSRRMRKRWRTFTELQWMPPISLDATKQQGDLKQSDQQPLKKTFKPF